MEQVITSSPQWTVSARSDGDVLAIRVGGAGLDLGFLGAPSGFTRAEIETWLTELIGVAGTTGGDSPAVRDPASSVPIPRVLHQALTGLLFYEAELWGAAGDRPPCAVACVAGAGAVALGWAGSGRVEISVDGRPFEPVWLLVRDQDGRDARAFVVDVRSSLEARVSWPADPEGVRAPEGEITARWPGLAEGAPGADGATQAAREPLRDEAPPEGTTAEPARRDGREEPAPASGRPRGFWQFRGWMDRLAGPRARQDANPDPAPEPEPIAHDVPGVPDLVPEPGPVIAEAPVAEEPAPGPVIAEVPVVEEPAPGPVVAEVPVVEEPAPGPVIAEVPVAEEPAPGPVIAEVPVVVGETLGAGLDQAVDPFDLGPMAEVEPESAPRPVVVEPVVETRSAPAPGPVVAGPVVGAAAEAAVDIALARALELVAENEPVTAPGHPPGAWQEPGAGGAREAEPRRVRPRGGVRHPAWPEPEEPGHADASPLWRRPWAVAAVLLALFAGGWLLGRVDFSSGGRSIAAAFKAIGLGPARYEVAATSRPSGAWIAVDGVDQARRTPATLQLKPGTHEVVFSFSGVGGSSHTVNGKRGQRVALDVELWGSLKVTAPGGSVPISVVVDGMPRGYAPLNVDRLQPGIHRLQFSGPGVAPWEQTVEVHVNNTAEVVAQPIASPATGVLEVRATLADEAGSQPLSGAQVWIDGQPRGATPLKLELPRGPHSVRVRYRSEDGAVQVIDLPGGNVRYATIELGLDQDAPRLAASLPGAIPVGRPTVLSASLERAREGDVREMWLHVRTPEGAWRRYPMTVMKAPGGLVGVALFPTVLFDGRGRTAWYVSALTPMGDEYFTEMQPAQAARN